MMKARISVVASVLMAIASQAVAESSGTPSFAPQLTVSQAQTALIKNALIAAPIAGVISEVQVYEGDRITEGDMLLRLDDRPALMELKAAIAAFDAAQMESENDVDRRYAERTLQVHLYELKQNAQANNDYAGTISQHEIEKTKMVVDQARLAIEQAEYDKRIAGSRAKEKAAAVDIAQSVVDRHYINSTISGMVAKVDVQAGEWVDAGQPIVRIISLDRLRIECFVDGANHGMELVGRPVQFIPDVSDGGKQAPTLVGHVTFVSPELHAVTGQVRMWATVENPGYEVRAGMQGRLIVE